MACGERLLLHSLDRNGFEKQAAERYRLEPYIPDFAKFDDWQGKRVLEIGVGLGADHQRFVESGRGDALAEARAAETMTTTAEG